MATDGPGARGRDADPGKAWVWWVSFVFPAGLSVWLVVNGTSARPMPTVAALGVVGLVVVWALVLVFFLIRRAVLHAVADDTPARLRELSESIERLSGQASLSDDARRVINRRRERELLRAAIEEDVSRGDWEAAMVLVKELADRFGYRADAEEFRRKIESARSEGQSRELREAIAILDGYIIQRRWDEAMAEAAKTMRLFPDSPRVEGLRARVEQARGAYKLELERQFFVCAKEERIEDAMELLKELDHYLTEEEAAPLRETARGVIGKARENLGALFKLAVQDHRWDEASRLGAEIITQFPNTRMAAEVRGIIDGIRVKAGEMVG